jgi:ATP-dependent helicase/DNAse subunit B
MNVTALSNYLKCPLQFYFQNLVRVPQGKSEAAEFGSAVHHALQRLFEKMQQAERFPKNRNSFSILNGTCTAIAKVLPKNSSQEEWNTARKY